MLTAGAAAASGAGVARASLWGCFSLVPHISHTYLVSAHRCGPLLLGFSSLGLRLGFAFVNPRALSVCLVLQVHIPPRGGESHPSQWTSP